MSGRPNTATAAPDTSTAAAATTTVKAAAGRRSQPAGPAVHTPKKAQTVTVCCKIPAGLRLQLCRPVEWAEETRGGTMKRVRWDRVGDIVFVRGSAEPVGQAPKGYVRPIIVGGYGVTRGVDAEFWGKWLEQNKDSDYVKNGMIFAEADYDSALDHAEDGEAVRSGLEPLDMANGDARQPKSMDPNVQNIEKMNPGPR